MAAAARFLSDTAHGKHPGLADRKALAARMLAAFVRVQAEQGSPVDKGFHDLQPRIDGHMVPAALEDHAKPLSQFLQDLVDDLRRVPASPAAKPLIDRFEIEARTIDCARCVALGKGQCPCAGKLSDTRNLEGAGLCWSLLTELFDRLVALAEEAYRLFLQDCDRRKLHLRLETVRTTDPDLAARTLYPADDETKRRATIELRLPVEEFDDKHLIRMPYVLFHEICVHGPEAWLGGSRSEPGPYRTTELCAFREGFVDAAAAWLLRNRLVNAPEKLGRHQHLADAYSFATMTAHSARIAKSETPSRSNGEKDRNQRAIRNSRRQGAALFDRLLMIDDNYLKVSGLSLAQLAFALNLLSLTEDERTSLVQTMAAASREEALATRRDWFLGLLQSTNARDLTGLRRQVEDQVGVQDFGD